MQRFTFPEHGGQLYADRIRSYMDAMGVEFDPHTSSNCADHGITVLLDAVMTDEEFSELQAQAEQTITSELSDRMADLACRFVSAMIAHDLVYHWDDCPQEILNDDYGFGVPARDIERIREWSRFFAYLPETLDCNGIIWYGFMAEHQSSIHQSDQTDLTGPEQWVIAHTK